MKRRLWIISELFFPNESATAYILTEMAKAFASRFEVHVICADDNYETDAQRMADGGKTLPGIDIIPVKVPGLDKNSLPKRAFRLLSVSRALCRAARKNLQAGDLVFAVTNPALLLLQLRKLKKQLNFEYVLLVHDVFPDNALASGVLKPSVLTTGLDKLFRKAYAAADKVLVLGRDMQEVVQAKTGRPEKVFVCENWGEDDILPQERPEDGRVVLQYAGNLGRVQGLQSLLPLVAAADNAVLQFDCWGSGALVPYVSRFAAEHPEAQLQICGSYGRGEQQRILGSCDLAVVSLAKGMKGLGVPSKTYNILAAGKPILYIGDPGSEIDRLVKENDLGVCFDWDHTAELTRWLSALTPGKVKELKEKGKRSRQVYERSYTKALMLDKTLETLCL